jgi:hypothetical protein
MSLPAGTRLGPYDPPSLAFASFGETRFGE